MHPMLDRLDDIAAHLATCGDVLAVLGLGSAGAEHDRLDDHSDLDFFVIVEDDAKPGYLESIDWLAAAHPVSYSYRNDANGRRALFADGIFIESAIFTLAELKALPYTGARVVWRRPDAPEGIAAYGPPPPQPEIDSVEFHLNEALINLYIGMHRELRGERLTAARFIQSFAVDRIISLLRLKNPSPHHRLDPFEPSRRVEQAYPSDTLPLARMVPGYDHNREAAAFTLTWLKERFEVDAVIAAAIESVLTS